MKLAWSIAVCMWLTATAANAIYLTPGGTAVEFYNSDLKHYFRTAEPAEVTAVTNGAAGANWFRTLDDFAAWSGTVGLVDPNAKPVYRFYTLGANSHFYTIVQAEADQVKLDPGWKYEGVAFYALPATPAGCPTDYTPVLRAYNKRFAQGDSNHRFTTLVSEYQRLVTIGWAGEGVVFCSPKPTTEQQQNTEKLLGGSWTLGVGPGGPRYPITIRFTSIARDADGTVKAVGFARRTDPASDNRPADGSYSVSGMGWSMHIPYGTASSPSDFFAGLTLAGDVMSGCYYYDSTGFVGGLGPCRQVVIVRGQ